MKKDSVPGSWAWPVALRAWALLGAVIAAAVLRGWTPGRSHMVSDAALELLAVLAWFAAHATTAAACAVDVCSESGRGRRWGSAALGSWSVAALLMQAWLVHRLLDYSRGPVLVWLATGSAVLLGLIGLVADERRWRAGGAMLLSLGIGLTGVAIPVFSRGPCDHPRAKALEDLDTIRNAITLHDSQNKPLEGHSLQPLVGRYLQEIPKDRWGSDYGLDASVGVIVCFGADQKAGGTEEDADLAIHYKAQLKLKRAVLEGRAGPPAAGMRLRLEFNKRFQLTGDPRRDISVIVDPRGGRGACLDGSRATAGMSWGAATWELEAKDERAGVLVFRCAAGDPAATIAFGRGTSVDVGPAERPHGNSIAVDGDVPTAASLHEVFAPGSYLDPSLYGRDVMPLRPATALDLIGGEHRGVPIELAP